MIRLTYLDAKLLGIASTVSTDTSFIKTATPYGPLVVETRQAALPQKTVQPVEPQPVSVDARYTKLEQYLKDKQWKKADDETYRLMITEVGNEEGQWFTPDELPNSPCEPLSAIDGLWVKHSGGRFGFSVQKKMYLEYGGVPDGQYDKSGAFKKLCEANGWQVDGEWVKVTFDTSSPKGHLPCFRLYIGNDLGQRGRRSTRFSSLAARLVNCNL